MGKIPSHMPGMQRESFGVATAISANSALCEVKTQEIIGLHIKKNKDVENQNFPYSLSPIKC